MNIEILTTKKGSPDGIQVHEYEKGEVYKVPSPRMTYELAEIFLQQKWAKEVKDPSPQEDKQLKPDLEYKDMKVPELKKYAEKAGIEDFANMKKDELIAALEGKE